MFKADARGVKENTHFYMAGMADQSRTITLQSKLNCLRLLLPTLSHCKGQHHIRLVIANKTSKWF